MIKIKDKIFKLKKEFVNQFVHNDVIVDSIFLIGSCAGKEDDFNDWYQDFDIHLLLNKAFIPFEELEQIGAGFEKIKKEFNSYEVLAAWKIKDRHWKLVPDNNYSLNLSIHGTIVNRFDLYRRIRIHPILGWNMYQLCEPLYGAPPSTYYTLNKPTLLDLFHSVGGVSWMIENFYRAIWFYFTDPEGQEFYPFIQGYCWNVPSSIMLQYYLARNGVPGTRKDALKYLQSDPSFPPGLRDQLDIVVQNKRKSEPDREIHKTIINAAYSVSSWLIREMKRQYGIIQTFSQKDRILKKNTLYKSSILEVLGNSRQIEEVHFYINFEEDDFYESFKEWVNFVNSSLANASYCELPEFLKEVIHKKLATATKIYFWNDLNIMRYNLSHDFNEVKGFRTPESVFWGWESGTQALLQRLNEFYIQRNGNGDLDVIGTLFYRMSADKLKSLSINNIRATVHDIKGAIEALSKLNKESIIL